MVDSFVEFVSIVHKLFELLFDVVGFFVELLVILNKILILHVFISQLLFQPLNLPQNVVDIVFNIVV